MKLDRLKFGELIGYCANRGMTVDNADVKVLDQLTEMNVEPIAVTSDYINPEVVNELMRAIHAGEKIAAIKAYRAMTGYSLKEAKDAVELGWPSRKFLNENDELYVMLKEGKASAECQKDAAKWIKDLYENKG